MEARAELRSILETLAQHKRHLRKAYKYNSMEQFVLAHVKDYVWRERPKGIRQKRMGLCYSNAQRLMLRNDLTYVEGYAYGVNAYPILHAWCIDESGLVIEPTRTHCKAYIGVPFSTDFVMSVMAATGEHRSLIDDWRNGWPLVKGLSPRKWAYKPARARR
jgi:hypothetical protein